MIEDYVIPAILAICTIAVIVIGGLAIYSAITNPAPNMYVRGYVPQESGERVTCVYDKKWISNGKSGHYQHNLYCSSDN
jgi:hypothetical protein